MVNNVFGGDASVLGIQKTESELENLFGVKLLSTESNTVNFQIGINSSKTSGIELELGFVLEGLSSLRNIGLDKTIDYLSVIDNSLKIMNTKQTEFGAIMNRLDSALEEISIKYENLASSRSTIRDADIAEVSSEYIKQQILQQASATLMATANQSPAIALQLI
jgi:flagellin